MNDTLQQYARDEIKTGLQQCTEAQQLLFKRMYAHGNLELSIDTIVDQMKEENLDHAMQQVANTLKKKGI